MTHAADPDNLAAVAPEFFVPDVEAAVRFYEEKLGFTRLRVDPDFAIVRLGHAFVLLAAEALYVAMGGAVDQERGVGVDIRLMVSDVDEVYARCVANGVEVVHDIADRPYGLRDFIVRDLNGFRLRFASTLG